MALTMQLPHTPAKGEAPTKTPVALHATVTNVRAVMLTGLVATAALLIAVALLLNSLATITTR